MEYATDRFVKEDIKSAVTTSGALHSTAVLELSSRPHMVGTISRQNLSQDHVGEHKDNVNLALANKLTQDIANLSKSEKDQFAHNMQTFLYRASQPTLDGNTRMDGSEVDGTLKACDRLLNPDESGRFLDRQFGEGKGDHLRTMLAEQIMAEAAYPSNTDQGRFGTCPLASMETRTWFDKPSVAASIIADEALSGKWTAEDGNVVELPQKDFIPDKYSQEIIPQDGQRSYAGQIFQATAFSDWGTRLSTPKYYATDGIVQKLGEDKKLHDEGVEYRSDAQGNKIDDEVGFDTVAEAQELARLDGPTAEVLSSRSGPNFSNIVRFRGKEALEQRLKEAQESGKMPVVISVSGYDKFFLQDRTDLSPPRDPDTGKPDHSLNHFICIDKYNEADKTLVIDNQWGSNCDWGTAGVLGSLSDKEYKHPKAARIDDFFPATQEV